MESGTRVALLALATAFGVCCVVRGQTTGAIEGFSFDPSGGTIASAEVRITHAGTGLERRLHTDAAGRYFAPGLSPGRYDLLASHPGFAAGIRRGVELAAGRVVRIDFRLQLGEVTQTLEVTGETPLVNPSPADWGGSVGRRDLDELPLSGRDLFGLAAQQPWVILASSASSSLTTGAGIQVSILGARPNQNAFRLDGVYINDATGVAPASAAGRLLGTEGISELRLVTSPFSAEYGRAAGAVITAVTRSGTNQYHGTLYEFGRNSALNAKNFFDPHGEKTPPLRRHQFGALLGGPLRRNRLFFLGNYEGIREIASRTQRSVTIGQAAREGRLPGEGGFRIVPVAEAVKPYLDLYPAPNGRDFNDGTAEYVTDSVTNTREDYFSGKLDFVWSDQLRSALRYHMDRARTSNPDPFKIWTFLGDSRHQVIQTETSYVASPDTIHTFRTGFSRIRNAETSELPAPIPASLSFVKGQPLGTLQVAGLTDLGGPTARIRPRRFITNDFQFQHDATLVHGNQMLRFGAGYDRVQFNQRADVSTMGLYRFDSLADLLQARPRVGDLMAPGSDTIRGWRQHQFAAFLQDELRAGARFRMTLGVRYETYSPPSEVNGKISTLRDPLRDSQFTVGGPLFVNPSRKNFAPRAAVAVGLDQSGRAVLRAGVGIFFDLLGTRELIVAGVRVPPFFRRLAPTQPEFPDLLAAARAAPASASVDAYDYHVHQPYVFRFQAALERQFGADFAAQIAYTGARGIHLPGMVGDINPPRPEILPDGRLFSPPGAPRLNPAFDQVAMRRTQFNSFYHAFLVSVQKRWARSVAFQAKYTWSKSLDETSTAIFGDFLNGDRMPTVFRYRWNRGPSDFDVRHAAAASFSWEIPSPDWRRLGSVLGGWQTHGLLHLQSGPPFSPRVGFDRARISLSAEDFGQRPDFAALPGSTIVLGDPQKYFDPMAFALPAAGFLGNLGRNAVPGPGLAALDLALHKLVWRREGHSLAFRAEVFNLANHPNYQVPSGMALFNNRLERLGAAGRITQTTTPARQIQFALKYSF
jgi:hypothetical protein